MIVDTHQHFWNLEREPMPWMRPAHAAIARTFEPPDLRPLLDACGIDSTILVQAACTDTDTDTMFQQADANTWIGAVTAWVDLTNPHRARARLDRLARRPKFRGIRHLIHEEDDAHWILRENVLESIALLEDRHLVLELVCVYPRHLGDVPELAQRFPDLTIVIDHLGKPPLLSARMADWTTLVQRAAAHGNVAAKISGLNTVLTSAGWTASDWSSDAAKPPNHRGFRWSGWPDLNRRPSDPQSDALPTCATARKGDHPSQREPPATS